MGEVDVASLIKQRLKNDVRAFAAAEVSEITVEVNFFCVFVGSQDQCCRQRGRERKLEGGG